MNYKHLVIQRDSTAVVRLHAEKRNALGLHLTEELDRAFAELRDDDSVKSVVLWGGDGPFFSYGLDVAQLMDLDEQQMRVFFDHFTRIIKDIFFFPKPTVAAINGHAMGGGLLLAAACDFRVAAESGLALGLPEVQLGVGVPFVAVRMMLSRWGPAETRRLVLTGAGFSPAEGHERGLIEELAAPDQVRERAEEHASGLGALPGEAYSVNKRFLEPAIHLGDPQIEERENLAWIATWFDPDTRERLRKLAERR
jgi:enoyl-CoA hydratase